MYNRWCWVSAKAEKAHLRIGPYLSVLQLTRLDGPGAEGIIAQMESCHYIKCVHNAEMLNGVLALGIPKGEGRVPAPPLIMSNDGSES